MRALLIACALSLAAAATEAQPSPRATGAVPPQTGAGPEPTAGRDTLERIVPLPEIVVSTSRAGANTPIARSVLDRDQIAHRNWGQDTPMALATLPGAYAYSDAGNGIGYSYLAIRGFPQRRISVLVNGVPLNDPESHEVYWIDHPDLLSSTAEAQVQRGVGSALYGAASVGGSVNLETSPFSDLPRASAVMGYGSFETRRLMVEMNSGRLAGGWNFYGRYSRIESDGYRERSDSRLWSYALSARRMAGHQSFRVNLYGGPEETHLAYLGVPQAYLDGAISGDRERDRRMNPLTYDGERDHFFEPHYELIHSWSPAEHVALTQTLFYFDGEGWYDEQRFDRSLVDYRLTPWATSDSTLYPRDYYADADGDGWLDRDSQGRVTVERFDLVRRRWVKNRHYGWIPRVRLELGGGTLTVGGELRWHDGHHVGSVISGSGMPPGTEPDHLYYDYHPRTFAGGLFTRAEWTVAPRLVATGDLAWRHQRYDMRDDRFDGISFEQPYDFALPRLGITYTPRSDLALFAAASLSSREPAFRDLYDAEGAGSVPLFKNGQPLIQPEHVLDFELGGTWSRPELALSANLFRMNFKDELVYAGQYNTDLGYSTIGNAAQSVHQGVELAARAERPVGRGWRVALDANATLSDNYFVEYHEVYGPTPADIVSYDGKALGFFPDMLGNLAARLSWRGASLGVEAHQAGRIYLDNAESRAASIGPRSVLNLSAGYTLPVAGSQVELSLRVLNALDREYATSGYMDYDATGNLVPQFIPAATRSVLGQLRVDF